MIDDISDQMLRFVGPFFQIWKKQLYEYSVYINQSIHYDAPLWPFKIYWIKTDKVNHISKNLPSNISSIRSGEWDLDKRPIEDHRVFKSFRDHFMHDTKWSDTDYYSYIESKMNNDVSTWKGCKTMTDANERLSAYDKLYETIKSNGFKSQAELRNEDLLNSELRKLRYHPPELEDIAMNLSRDGEYLISNGVHRVSIAKILNIDEIPVRVRSRHEIWQQKRDKVWLGQEVQGSTYDHPDITPLL